MGPARRRTCPFTKSTALCAMPPLMAPAGQLLRWSACAVKDYSLMICELSCAWHTTSQDRGPKAAS